MSSARDIINKIKLHISQPREDVARSKKLNDEIVKDCRKNLTALSNVQLQMSKDIKENSHKFREKLTEAT